MAVAGHQLQGLGGGGSGGGSIAGIQFVGAGINNFISASTTEFFFNNITGAGSTTVYKLGNVFVISGQPATQITNISGGTGATITALSTSVIARPQATSGLASSFQATVVDTVLNRSGSTLVFSQTRTNCYEDDSVTFAKMQEISAYTMMGNATNSRSNPYEVPIVFPYDNQQQQYKNTFNGIDEINSVSIYSLITGITSTTSTPTPSNLLPEYSSYTSFIGTRTIPANFLVKGKTIRVKARGYTTTNFSSSIYLGLKLIDTATTQTYLLTGTSISIPNATNTPFNFEFEFCCREIGSSGKINSNGSVSVHTSSLQTCLASISDITVDTTKLYYLQLDFYWVTSSTVRNFVLTHTSIEILN
jgi:hypothetical protein